ncbi:MAG: response regulator [Alphaproteobacteria bacterium]|nr:response regulator [Alphaproteobacteria bacterium]OJV47071.1 MAG: two-component system response regulator [Alphaproteobacteria bacterium 43-37]
MQNDELLKPKLLIVDDNIVFLDRLGKAMESKGFVVTKAESIATCEALLAHETFTHTILDMKLEDGHGLDLVTKLKSTNPGIRIIMLTAYANIASAVAAIKLGAIDYLPKPADADQIYKVLMGEKIDEQPNIDSVPSPDRIRWEYIQRSFEECDHNVSATARKLKMHRRTLQRILSKYAPKP